MADALDHMAALDIEDTGTYLGKIGRTKVFELIKAGEIRAVKLGRRTVIPVTELDAFIARQLADAA
jgi:excisionase family DNA binding protein